MTSRRLPCPNGCGNTVTPGRRECRACSIARRRRELGGTERQRRAADMRASGATYAAIGAALGVSAQRSVQLVRRALLAAWAEGEDDGPGTDPP